MINSDQAVKPKPDYVTCACGAQRERYKTCPNPDCKVWKRREP